MCLHENVRRRRHEVHALHLCLNWTETKEEKNNHESYRSLRICLVCVGLSESLEAALLGC